MKQFTVKSTAFFLFYLFTISLIQVSAQVSMNLNYNTQEITFTNGYKFKVGENIRFCITDYDKNNDDQYTISYLGDEYKNETGIAQFSESKVVKAIEKTSKETYCYLPIQIQDKDYSVLTLKRFRKEETNPVEERVYRYRNQCSIKFDVSSGIFVTRQNEVEYALKTIQDTPTLKQIIKEDIGKHRVGVGLLAHLHSRFPCWLNIGGSVGFELNGDAKISYLSGISLFFGYDRKFVLTGGIALSKHKQLSSLYKDNDRISSEVNELPLVEKWSCNFFGALTYNF